MPNTINTLVPSRLVLIEAEKINARNGHENLGFLSEKYGFLPVNPPLTSLPSSHRLWDEIASELPNLYESVAIRHTLSNLPELDASIKSLDDKYLFRAATILGMFAHAYYWLEMKPPMGIPACIMEPWREVSTRLYKPGPFFSYSELVFYNWQYRYKNNDVRLLENLSLLVRSVGKREEEIFYLSMVEMAAVSAPIIGSVVRAQEAIVKNDIKSLKNELTLIIECAEQVNNAFSKIELNPFSKTYVDPVVWGKCIGILLVPWDTYGVKGPSGTASPYFHLLDTILDRKRFNSQHGQNQIHYKHVYNSIHVKDFLSAVEKISIRNFVEKSSDSSLKGLFYQLMETYAGETGLLGIHQRKAYGYSSTVFKIGRVGTTAGSKSQCPFIDRTWDEVDIGLAASREERDVGVGFDNPIARVNSVSLCNKPNASIEIQHIVLDIKNTGINYKPGDRCGILPENSDELVRKTLKSLLASEEDYIFINKAWREALKLRPEYNDSIVPEKILLSEFLRYAKIRPLIRSVAEALYAIVVSPSLRKIIDSHQEDQWELWDAISLFSNIYDVKRFWKVEPWHKENLSNIVPPEQFRLYSISSNAQDQLDLTVGTLKYKTKHELGEIEDRSGTASNFINHLSKKDISRKKPIAVQIIKPRSFKLPVDNSKPIVMFAGGTGISPFRSFMLRRSQEPNSGENLLFYGIKTPENFCYQDEIERWIAAGKLNVKVKISGADVDLQYEKTSNGGHFNLKKGSRGYITSIIENDENAKHLWELLCNEELGGKGAYFYVCGTALFFDSIFTSLRSIIMKNLGDEQKTDDFLYSLVAEKRLMQDILTPFAPAATGKNGYRIINISEIALHNNQEKGFWLIVSDEVYDVSDYIFLHPGGDKILTGYAGMDATKEYQAVKHHLDSSVNAILSAYKIGAVRKIDFDSIWGIAVVEKKLDYVSLEEVYGNWLSYLYLVIEMQNAQVIDVKFYQDIVVNQELTDKKWRFAMQSFAKLIGDFLEFYFAGLISEKLQVVWRTTVGLCMADENFFLIAKMVKSIKEMPEYKAILNRIHWMIDANKSTTNFNITKAFNEVQHHNATFLDEIKMNILDAIKLFEMHEQNTVESASHQLIDILKKNSSILQSYIIELSYCLRENN